MEGFACNPNIVDSKACPVFAIVGRCFTDQHHLEFPAPQYRSPTEKLHRNQSFNKVNACRALHNAIHASGYVPEKPQREVMAQEIWDGGTPLRALVEGQVQLLIGQQAVGEEITHE